MPLKGTQIEDMHRALMSAFSSEFALDFFVTTKLGASFPTVAHGGSLAERIFNLIQWANSHGKVEELIKQAAVANPGNSDLCIFAKSFLKPFNEPIHVRPALIFNPKSSELLQKEFVYDFFLGYSEKDRVAVRALAEHLQQDGWRIWFEEWAIHPDDPRFARAQQIEEGLATSSMFALCLSKQISDVEWKELERQALRFRVSRNTKRGLLLIRLDETPIQGCLSPFPFIRWPFQGNEQDYTNLKQLCPPMQAKQVNPKRTTISIETDDPDEMKRILKQLSDIL